MKTETMKLLERVMALVMDVAESTSKSVHVSITIEPDGEKKKNDDSEVSDEKKVFVTMTVEPFVPSYPDEEGSDG